MAYYPHPEGSPTRHPQTGVRERPQARWWHSRAGVAGMVGLLALVALVTGGLLQLSYTAQAWWLAERTAALEHELEVQAHGRAAELELQKQRVAFHLGYVGMAMDRSRSDSERLTVLRLLDGFDGDPDVQRWARVELAETEARLAAGEGRPGVADLASAEIDPPGDDAAVVELEDGEAGDAEEGDTVDTALAAPELRPSLVTTAHADAQVGQLAAHTVRPAPTAAAPAPAPAPAPAVAPSVAPAPPAVAAVAAPAPAPVAAAAAPVAAAAAPTAPIRQAPPVAAKPAPDRAPAAERQPRPRPPTSRVITGADRRTRCASGSVRTLRRVGADGPTCGAGPGSGQQALLTGDRVEWISYGDPSDKSSFVECACSVAE
ncbi:MAG: hypothetical protein R3F39_04085 [Myxococcota bacterium]